jgi:hypothetical protein
MRPRWHLSPRRSGDRPVSQFKRKRSRRAVSSAGESSRGARLTAKLVEEVARDFLSLVDGEIDAKAPVGSVARRLENVWRFVRGVLSRLADGTDMAQPVDGPEALIDEEREALDATVAWVDRMRNDCACLVEPLAGHVAFPVELEAQVTEFLLAVRDAADRRGPLPTELRMKRLRNKLDSIAVALRTPRRDARSKDTLDSAAPQRASATVGATPGAVQVGPGFAWIKCPRGDYTFPNPKQRAVMTVLHDHWLSSGDDLGITEAAILEHEIEHRTMFACDELRLTKAFRKHRALGRIIVRAGNGMWALRLGAVPPSKRGPREVRQNAD